MEISIVTVTYNAEKYIECTLNSILKQTYLNYELIIIDGASSDSTIKILETYYNKISSMKIISERDRGIYDAMNKGANIAKGNFILFLNAGDSFYNENVLTDFESLAKDFRVIYYGDAFGVDGNGKIDPYRVGHFTKYRLSYTNICHQTIFYPRFLFCNNKFDLQYKVLADWDFNMRMMQKSKFCYLNCPIVLYDLSGISANVQDKVFEKRQKAIILKYLGIDTIFFLLLKKMKSLFN